jgi:hypothetical protein
LEPYAELLDRAGCTDAFVTLGNKVDAANIIADKTVVGHVNFSDVDSPYPFALMLPQSDTERLLEEHLGRLGINTQRQTELSRQKATHAVTPIARWAIPTSNWKGLTCHPMWAAATAGKKICEIAAQIPVTPIGKNRIQARKRSAADSPWRDKAASTSAAANRKAGRLRKRKPIASRIIASSL